MLEKPSIPDEALVSAVQTAFGLRVTELTFLPLGADQNTAAYRAEADNKAYFLKLRSGICHEASVTLPRLAKQPRASSTLSFWWRPWVAIFRLSSTLSGFSSIRSSRGAMGMSSAV